MHLLALDVGTRRTGCAFCDDVIGIPLPLDTLMHSSTEELIEQVSSLAKDRGVTHIIIGNPLLPSGRIGAQALLVKQVADLLSARGFSVQLFDERYTTVQHALGDGDAQAACTILLTYLARKGI